MKTFRTYYTNGLRLIFICAISCFALTTNALSQSNIQAEGTYQKANVAFRNAKYEEAKLLYLNVLKQGGISDKLYFNLGNTYFKLTDYTHALLYFEKAYLQNPSDEDVHYNLTLVRGLVGDKTDEIRPFFLRSWLVAFSGLNSSDQWAWWALGSFVMLSISVILFLLFTSIGLKKVMVIVSLTLFLVFLSSSLCSYYRYNLMMNSGQAIVGQSTINVKSSPSTDGTDIFIVHEGTKIQMLDSVGTWKEIRVPDGNRGWVMKDSLLPI